MSEQIPPAYIDEDEDIHEDEQQWTSQEPISRRPRRRLLTPLTALLFAVLVGVGGFIAGVQVEKGEVPASSTRAGAGRLAGALSAAGGASSSGGSGRTTAARGFGGGLAGASGSATVGQVAYVSGPNLFVTNLEGNTVKVSAGAAQITKQVSTSVKGVHPGDTVVVQGTKRADGSILAATVRDSGSSGTAGGLGGLFGGGSAGGAGASGSGTGSSGSSSASGGSGASGAGGRTGSRGGEPALFGG
jgi:hypothetical protein